MRKLAAPASGAGPVQCTTVAACAVALFSPGSDVLESTCEDGGRTSSWNTRW
jgi:hypothetical protein